MEADKERIIPITILSSQHHKSDENDNKGLSRSAAAANNNNDDHNDQVVRPKRQSLVVTLEDGTVTETLGILENQESTGWPNKFWTLNVFKSGLQWFKRGLKLS